MALTTELEAVNSMLAAVGEYPIESLNNPLTQAQQALRTLRLVTREIQSGSWDFNQENGIELTPGANQQILIPTDYPVVSLDVSDPTHDVVVRGGKLYDRTRHSYAFADKVKVDVTWLFPFDELPEPAKQYVYVKATRRYIKDFFGDAQLNGMTREDEQSALINLLNYDCGTADYNILYDNNEAYSIIAR